MQRMKMEKKFRTSIIKKKKIFFYFVCILTLQMYRQLHCLHRRYRNPRYCYYLIILEIPFDCYVPATLG